MLALRVAYSRAPMAVTAGTRSTPACRRALPTNPDVRALAVDPTDNSIYAGTCVGGVFKNGNGYVVSGTVTSGGVGLGAVTVTLTGSAAQTTVTESDGTYHFTGLADGVYTVTPTKGSFTFSPQSRSFNINGADVTGLDFALQSGSLKVNIIPKGAVSDGARWKVDNGSWRKSGATIAILPVGVHMVTFKAVPGWVTPAKQTVNIVAGGTELVTGRYQTLDAEFSAVPVSGKAPLKVKFTDQSTGPVAGWLWDFGDNSTSTKQHPIHIYTKVGTYPVTLSIKKGNCISSLTKKDFIAVYKGCQMPGVPTSPSPANGASGVDPASPQLAWAPASDAIEYDVRFGTSPSPPLVATVSTPWYTPSMLIPGATYYWGVAAKNGCGQATSEVWTFSTSNVIQP